MVSDEFIDEYYQWLKDCIILPHFGLSAKKIYPIYGKIIATISSKIQYNIIEKIYIEFNHARTKAFIEYELIKSTKYYLFISTNLLLFSGSQHG
jgi:hypothetical protein